MPHIFNRTEVKSKRQRLRKNMPDAEVLLWNKLRSKQILGFRFRRQYSVGAYIIDFYCRQLKLGIEVDGESHFAEGAKQYDQRRQNYIESFGIKLVRFLNTDVYENMDGVLEALVQEMNRRASELIGRKPDNPL